MLQVIRFILNCVVDFAKMLFTIDLGNNLNLGLLCCIIFIFLPIVHRVICFIKQDAMEELNERYDESRPRETWTSNEYQWYRSPGSNRNYGKSINTSHIRTKSRRYKI